MVPIEKPKNHPIDKHNLIDHIFIRMLLIWDVMGGVMGVVWGVANFTALLFFPAQGKSCHHSNISEPLLDLMFNPQADWISMRWRKQFKNIFIFSRRHSPVNAENIQGSPETLPLLLQ